MAQTTRPPAPRRRPPYAEEVAESRIGLTTGIYGAQNVTRTWRVYCSSATANPVQTILNLSSKDGGVKIGELFPKSGGWGDGTYVLLYFTIIDHWIGTSVWVLQGHYGPSYLTGFASTLWEFNIRGSLQAERVFTTLSYMDGNQPVASKNIGPPRYKQVTSGTAGAFTAQHPERGTVYLAIADGGNDPTAAKLPRFTKGADAPARVSTINLWKTIPTWRYAAVSSAMNNKRYVNSDSVIVQTTSGTITWVNANDGRGTLLMDDISVDPISPSQQPGQPLAGDGPAFRVGITLKFDPDGWQHYERHMYRWDDGTESQIVNSEGNFINEEFRVVGETSFTALLGAFV